MSMITKSRISMSAISAACVRRQVKQTDVFTTSLKKAKRKAVSELEVLGDEGKVLHRAKTDGDGHGVLPGLPANARLFGFGGNEISMVALQEPGLDLASLI